jgi:hypothetical protein
MFQKVTEGGKFNAQKEMDMGEEEVKTVDRTKISAERETGPIVAFMLSLELQGIHLGLLVDVILAGVA